MVGDTPLRARDARGAWRDTGVRVLDIEIFRLKPDTDVADYRPALETGARLGAREALVAGNDPDEARLVDRFARVLRRSRREFGIGANLEPMPWTDVQDVRAGRAHRRARPRATTRGVLIDPIHFDRGGCRGGRHRRGAARSRLRYMQLCDAPAERPRDTATLLHQARAERLMPGDGGLDLDRASCAPSRRPADRRWRSRCRA